jgi:hypothetical protein
MWTAIDEDRPIERAHELHAVADDLPRDRIEVLQNPCTANAAPLVRRRVRPALILRCAPDRFGCGIGAKTASLVERETEIVGQRRLSWIFIAIQPPFSGDIGRPRTTALGGPHGS